MVLLHARSLEMSQAANSTRLRRVIFFFGGLPRHFDKFSVVTLVAGPSDATVEAVQVCGWRSLCIVRWVEKMNPEIANLHFMQSFSLGRSLR